MIRKVIIKIGTTGLNKDVDRISELACIEVVNGKKGDVFHRYINPTIEFSNGATNCTKMKLEDLEDKPVFSEVYNDFMSFIEDSKLVMQSNQPNFDLVFIIKELSILDKVLISSQRIESVTSLYKSKMNHSNNISLDKMCSTLYIDINRSMGFTANYLCNRLFEVYSRLNHIKPLARKNMRLRITDSEGRARAAHKIPNVPWEMTLFKECVKKRKLEELEQDVISNVSNK